MKKALVLSGGGSLGVYEMGVWKMLDELHMHFDIIVGTSIGAINGAMMATGEREKAYSLWEQITVSQVMKNGLNLNHDFWKEIDFRQGSKLRRWLNFYFKNHGANIAPFQKLIEKTIDPKKVKKSKTKLGVVAVNYKTWKEERFLINEMPTENVLDCLYASSACYPIFPKHTFKGATYVDGGWRNNMPVDYAFELGADEVVAVMLHSFPPTPQKPEYYNDLPNVTVIRPSLPQGTIMDFSKNRIRENGVLGYCDAGKTFGALWGYAYTFRKDKETSKKAHGFYMDILKEGPAFYQKCVKAINVHDKGVQSEIDFYLLNLERLARLYELTPFKVYEVMEMENLLKEKILSKGEPKGKKAEICEKYYLHALFGPASNEQKPELKDDLIKKLDIAFHQTIQ